MQFAGEDAINRSYNSGFEGDYDSRIAELLAADESDAACELVQNYLASGVEANCWLAKIQELLNLMERLRPGSGTVNSHGLIVDGHLWTISLDLWERGS